MRIYKLRKFIPVIFWGFFALYLIYISTEHQACTYTIVNHVALLMNCHQVPFWSHAPALVPGR